VALAFKPGRIRKKTFSEVGTFKLLVRTHRVPAWGQVIVELKRVSAFLISLEAESGAGDHRIVSIVAGRLA